ncbi:MAG TPA: S9 family peptidase [Gaiellaceae bacterium]|nr:S9 family peptidase [Gaiellaceae bacterium]
MTQLPPFERFNAVRKFEPVLAFTADGEGVLFVSNISGQFNLWRVPATGGWPKQLTSYTDHTVRAVAVRADGLIAFSADHDGDELHRIYLLKDGWPEEIAGGEQVQHALLPGAFTPAGDAIAYSANSRTPTDSEVWLQPLEGGGAQSIFGEGMYAFPAGFSPDGSKLLALEFRTNTDQSLHLVDLAAGTSDELTPHDEQAKFFPGPWTAEGTGFYFMTDSGAEYAGLARYDLEARSWAYVEQPEADVEGLAGSADGSVIAWLENDRGWAKLRILGRPESTLPPGTSHQYESVLAVSPDGSRVAVLWDEPRRGQNVYVVDTATGEAQRVTDSSIGLPPADTMVEPELTSYASWDGLEIPAWLFRAPVEGPHPVVLYIHGGPESQERAGYKPFAQYLCSRGISVLATNIRGSTGYGKTYQRMIHRHWGDVDLKDWKSAAEWLSAQDWVDGNRIGVFGGSYGGFAVLTCMSRLPEHFAAGVDIFGPSNLITLVQSAPPTWRRMLRDWVGDAEEDREMLLAASPLTYADQIQAPLLVIQGANDYRVVKAESDQLVERLRELGTPVEYEVFEDEGHGFTKATNELRAWQISVDFLERHLTKTD